MLRRDPSGDLYSRSPLARARAAAARYNAGFIRLSARARAGGNSVKIPDADTSEPTPEARRAGDSGIRGSRGDAKLKRRDSVDRDSARFRKLERTTEQRRSSGAAIETRASEFCTQARCTSAIPHQRRAPRGRFRNPDPAATPSKCILKTIGPERDSVATRPR